MADLDSKWNQNIDKIAYGVAIALGFIVLCIPLLAGGSADTNSLDSALTELSRAIGKQKLPDHEPPNVKAEIVKQWTPGPAATQDPTWRTEAAPLLLLESEKVSDTPCVHEPGEIVELRCERDPQGKLKQAVIVIKGKPSEKNSNVVIKKMELQRKADGGTEDVRLPVPDFKATGEFELRDTKVEPGKVYTYRLLTVADRDPQLAKHFVFDSTKDGTKTSPEVTASGPVPYEISLVPTSFDQQDPTNPKFFGRLAYWDYSKGAIAELNKQFVEKEEVAGKRFQIQLIDAVGQKVVVREPGGNPIRNKWDFTSKSEPLPVKPFDAVIPGAPAPEPEAPAVDPKKSAKDAKDTKAAKTTPGSKTASPKDKKTDKKEPDKKGTTKKKGFTKSEGS